MNPLPLRCNPVSAHREYLKPEHGWLALQGLMWSESEAGYA